MSEGGRRRREGEGDEGNEHGRPQMDDTVGGEARVAKNGRGSAPFKRPAEAGRGWKYKAWSCHSSSAVTRPNTPEVSPYTKSWFQVVNHTIDVNCVLSR